MHDDGAAATAMLGLPGFVLLAVSEHDNELEFAIETAEGGRLPGLRCARAAA